MSDFWISWQPRMLSVFRFIVGFLFLWHGTQKLFGFPPSQGGGGQLSTLMAIGGLLELVGGVFIMLGVFTRWTAFILCGMMAVAYWGWHGTGAFLPIENRGELAVLYCFVFLYLFFAGGGSWAFDNFFKKREQN